MEFDDIEFSVNKETSINDSKNTHMEQSSAGTTHQLEHNQNNKQQIDEDNDREMNQKTETIGVISMGLNGINSVTLLIITAFISYLSLINGVVLFSFHPMLMSIGYLILMFQAILSMSDTNCWTVKLNYKQRVTLHWVLQTFSLILITFGFVAIFVNKINLGKEHFHTLHAIFGLITYILTVIVACGGIWTKYSFQLRQYLKPVYVKIGHSLMGVVVLCMGITTISLGIYSHWFLKVSTKEMQVPLVVLLVLCTLYVIYKPLVLCMKRITNSFRASL